MRSTGARLATVLTLVVLVTAGFAAPAAGQTDAETTVMHVSLQPNGDARWTVSLQFTLEDANETAAFESLADDFVAGDTDVLNADPYRAAADRAGESTGREMTVRSVDRSASRVNETGELRLSFTWTNFSRVEDRGQRLVLGDAFTTPSGTWLPGLQDDQVLVIEFPEGYSVESVSRGLDNRTLRVSGPASFAPGNPSATLEQAEVVSTSPSPTDDIDAVVPSAITAGAVLAILLVGAYLLYRRREGASPDEPGGAIPTEPDGDPADDVLLSDEERVLRLLRTEGGRMKQVDIVEETDWSNAKVSQLLSSMADEGHIEKLRIGRENLISLPDDEDG